jgi:hypothetical protein
MYDAPLVEESGSDGVMAPVESEPPDRVNHQVVVPPTGRAENPTFRESSGSGDGTVVGSGLPGAASPAV